MTRDRSTQTKLIRLGQILRIFMEKGQVSSSWLSQHFRTTPRTIQRDLLLLKESGFPLHEVQKGLHKMSKDLVKNLEIFDDTELALVVALKNIVGQLGQPFKKAADSVLDRLYDCVSSMPVFVKIDDAVPLDSALLNKIVRAVREKKQVTFRYAANKGPHPVQMEPYRVAYFGGFWYLIGNEPATGILKRYALDRISDIRLLKTCCKDVPEDLDDILHKSANIWFTGDMTLEVKVLIDVQVSHYFRRRMIFPTQELKEERPDGSLVITFRVGRYGAIRNVLKSWIPNIMILEPEDFRKDFLKDVKGWVKRQENAV
ncbi:MAG: WYL domain-containing transcriptional regulator [Deltaproteobacteria bacterium]|nr:WYL domain-containing transcriptional regulator [Deltaproteobacteria bacterium]